MEEITQEIKISENISVIMPYDVAEKMKAMEKFHKSRIRRMKPAAIMACMFLVGMI